MNIKNPINNDPSTTTTSIITAKASSVSTISNFDIDFTSAVDKITDLINKKLVSTIDNIK